MEDVGCAAELQIGSPCLTSRVAGFWEVIDMQITRGVCEYFQAASRLGARSITLWKCAVDSLGLTVCVG